MKRLLSVSILTLSVQTVSAVASQPGTPLPTVEQLDAAVAERALIDHFRRSEAGRMDEPKLATLQYLYSIEGLSQEELIAFGRELSSFLDAPNPPTKTADSPTIELGVTVNPSFLGPVGVRISVDQKVTKLLGDLVPDFVRSPSEPAVAAVARTPLKGGLLEMAALRETYDLWLDRRAEIPLEMELRSQELTAAIDRKLYLESAAYRAARPEFIDVAFKPTDTADAVLEAVPAFADSETGTQVAAELLALRSEIEADAVTDERIEELQRLIQENTNRTHDLHEQVIEVVGESLTREHETERRDSLLQAQEEERLKILQTDTENAMTVFGVTAGVLLRFAPDEVKETVKDVTVVVNASGEVVKAVRRFQKTPIGASSTLAHLALGGNIVAAAMSMLDSLLGTSPHQQVLEAIERLHELVEQVREEMHDRFDELFNVVMDAFVLLRQEHAITHARLDRIEDRLLDQLYVISGISEQLLGVRGALADMKRLVIEKVNQNSRHGCMRDPALQPPRLSAEQFQDCLEAFRNEFADQPKLQLVSDEAPLMGRQLPYAANLGLGEFRRLAGARDVGQLPSDVVGVKPLIGSIFALRDFLRQQAEHAETFADEIGRTELVRDALRYGDDLNTYIGVIVRELEAIEASEPSVFSDLVTEAETVVAAVERKIADAREVVFDGVEELPIDRITGTIPPWMKVIEDGRCPDPTVDTGLKRALLVDSPTVLGELIDRRDLRPARAGWGTVAACVRSQPERYQRTYYVKLELTIDFYPDPEMGAACAGRVRLVEDTRYVQTRSWTDTSHPEWRRLFRKGIDALLSRPAPTPVLPVGCRYRDHPERFDAENEKHVASLVRERVQKTIDDATERLDKAEATLLSWITTAFDGDRLLLGVVNNLAFPDLDALLVADDPHRLGDAAMAQLATIRQTLRSDAMRQVVRLDRGQLVLSDELR